MNTTRAKASDYTRKQLGCAAAVLVCLTLCSIDAYAQPKLTPRAYRLADAAYKSIADGNLPRAESYAERAWNVPPGSEQLGLLLLDVYVREGKTPEADSLAETLLERFPESPQVLAQNGFLAQRQQRSQMAFRYLSAALEKGKWTTEQQRTLRLAWVDSALTAQRPDEAEKALAPLADQTDAAVQLRLAQTRLIEGDRQSAVSAAQMALDHATTDADRTYAQAIIDQAHNAELQETQAAATAHLQAAYDLLRERKDSQALEEFQAGFDQGAGTAGNYADAAYAAKRTFDNERSVKLFEQSLDADDKEHAFDAQRRFGYKREVEELQREWGFQLSLPYQTAAFGPEGTVDVLQPGFEAYWQPPKIGYRDGRILQFFVRGYGTAYDGAGNVTSAPTIQGSVGVRYKPLPSQNLVVTGERLFKIGSLSTNDFLFRLGYSSEDGTDLRVTEPSWRSWQAYVEGAYFVNAGRYIIYTELRYGHTWRATPISEKLTVYPHVALAGDHDNKATDQTALGIGPGVQFRFWFRESKYRAPASWADVTVQYRFPLTSAARARGLVVRATLWF
ncbi:bacteriophage N4 adsorption protein A [Paraburkholderia sp. CNPSo 3157]|uniref:Bacteriophage N4 adsorption protein A n=1 Tax=Paraburkholderia franconis TaxID=2654983 RepID=A0A7X1N900_9BURK|nr:bacteriophage N4 adsorption protein A [Paraburkholderia franconis]MPW17612.1 bacteriophage N4 adsorption protein A [Paraburkholderia franconis]